MSRGDLPKIPYLRVFGGKVVEYQDKVQERADAISDEKLVEKGANRTREVFDGNAFKHTVLERVDDYVEGIITKITVESSDYGDEIKVHMQDVSEEFIVILGVEGSAGRTFMYYIPNAKPELSIRIRAWRNEKRKSEGVVLHQEDKKVDLFFSKDTPNGLPTPPEFSLSGEKNVPYEQWSTRQKGDYKKYQIDRNTFLIAYLEDEVAPRFTKTNANIPAPSIEEEISREADKQKVEVNKRETGTEPPIETDGDLPF